MLKKIWYNIKLHIKIKVKYMLSTRLLFIAIVFILAKYFFSSYWSGPILNLSILAVILIAAEGAHTAFLQILGAQEHFPTKRDEIFFISTSILFQLGILLILLFTVFVIYWLFSYD